MMTPAQLTAAFRSDDLRVSEEFSDVVVWAYRDSWDWMPWNPEWWAQLIEDHVAAVRLKHDGEVWKVDRAIHPNYPDGSAHAMIT